MELTTVIHPLSMKAAAKTDFAGGENTDFSDSLTTENIPLR